MHEQLSAGIIGGFTYVDPNCKGCGKPLEIKNAWMTDGCPCNSVLGVNNENETRWRLLMELQQIQSRALAQIEEMTWGGKGESAVHVVANAAIHGNSV